MVDDSHGSPTSSGLASVIAAVARGDQAAFATLYQATSAKLFGVCLRILPRRSDAEEVLQEAYVTIWRKAETFDPSRASPITWLVTIARNKAIDRARADSNEQYSVAIDLAADVSDNVSAESSAMFGAQGVSLRRCMDELEPKRRTLLRIAFYEGVTYDELASRSAVPLGTVKSLIRRGLSKLKECMQR
jgi:RNA polymerase sigma-70 factor, ECF subfamily